ncbi:MAG TPA: 2-oxoacid:acceptor oxidoreductase family protein, partial [Methylomirabilota bacterium]|nr:2-oxoacid:acceptor oxidoreductase family protein [Methylomirabilota bacterium]
PEYVDSPVVEHADLFVAFSQPAYRKFYELCEGRVLYDPELVEQVRADEPARHVAVPATQLSKERFSNQLFANMIMLGALTRLSALDREAMRRAMLAVIPRFHAQNVAALDLGYSLPEVAART